jgi:hypothetical protein
MAKKPLLIFPRATSASRDKLNSFFGNIRFPEKERQIQLLEHKVTDLERMLENQTAYLGTNPANLIPEMILVLEVAGDITDFFNAVRLVPGMEFLGGLQSEIEPDDDFFTFDKNGKIEQRFGARLFLTMTNQRALAELKSYWEEYKKEKNEQVYRDGTKKFRTLFEKLRDLRPYSIADRIYDTGMEDYLSEMKLLGIDPLRFEIELAYQNNPTKENRAFNEVADLIRFAGGLVVERSRVMIPEIGYHAFIAEAPIASFDNLTENTNVTFLKSQQVLYFRPVGQSVIFDAEKPQLEDLPDLSTNGAPDNDPVIALLDGLPLQNHAFLNGRLKVDDPDDFGHNYLAEHRMHGTAMASLILNGDLSEDDEPLKRSIYVRPILKTSANQLHGGEFLPDDQLPVDIVHRAVKRLFEGEDVEPPVAPNVRIINFSIGDPYRPFHYNISTWAKLIDWLSYRYNVLFIISAGNKAENLTIDIPAADFDTATIQEIEMATLKKIIETNFDRKILTPAESINSITVGSAHHDSSAPYNFPQRKNLISSPFLLSPISRIGFGYNNSIKPDILMPGGRKLYRKHLQQLNPAETQLRIEGNESLAYVPGNKVALPGAVGELHKAGYLSGTSNAAALTTNLAGKLYEMLLELNAELPTTQKIPEVYFTVLLKALLVHSSSWGEAKELFVEAVRRQLGVLPRTLKKHIFPYLGYGRVDSEKVIYCTDHRVTLMGFGELSTKEAESAHLYTFPLPPSLASKNIEKKLAITLAWLSPLNFNAAQYRKAHLFFDNLENNGYMALDRESHDYNLAKKGTVQHDVLTGSYADVFQDGNAITIKVNCRQDASGLSAKTTVRYGIAVTLEIKENVHTQIYEEIKLRLQERIRERI